AAGEPRLKVSLLGLAPKDRAAILEELGNLGRITGQLEQDNATLVWLETSCSADDIEAVACFIIDASQIRIEVSGEAPSDAGEGSASAVAVAAAVAAASSAALAAPASDPLASAAAGAVPGVATPATTGGGGAGKPPVAPKLVAP